MVGKTIIVMLAIFGLAQATCPCNDQLWGDENPNIFYFCNTATNTPVQQQCAEGRGFLKTDSAYGCVPFTEWPATCVTQVTTAPTCTGTNLNQPTEATNPNQYYLCTEEGAEPLLLSCNSGRGFLNGGSDGYLGCAEWSLWRQGRCNCASY